MKTEIRFIGQMFLFPLVAAVFLVAWCKWVDAQFPSESVLAADYGASFQKFCWLLGGSWFFSVVYATAMEVAYDLGLKPNAWATVLCSEVYGLLVGIFYDLVVLADNRVYNQGTAFEMVGVMTGLTMGLVVKMFFGKQPIPKLPLEI